MKPERIPDLLLVTVVVLVLSYSGARVYADPDLWGHLRFGHDILDARSVPAKDAYSFTSDRAWVNHEWLAEALMAVAYGTFGTVGLVGLRLALMAGTFYVIWRAMRRAGVFWPLSLVLLLVAAIGVRPQQMTVRPQLFSLLLFTILLALLSGVTRGRTKRLIWVPVVFALWANLHGGWIVGLVVLALWALGAFMEGKLTLHDGVAGVLLAALSTLATPYGTELWRFLWDTVGIGRADIEDWQPLFRWPSHLVGWVLTAGVAFAAWRRGGRASITALLPPIALGVLALRVIRLEGFFALATIALLAPYLASFGPKHLPLSRVPTHREVVAVGVIWLAGAGVAASAIARVNPGCLRFSDSDANTRWAPEVESVLFLKENYVRGRLLTFFDYGQMAIWHLAPGALVSYDGRRETVYSASVQDGHTSFYLSPRDASYARRIGADYVWLPHWLPVNAALAREGWVAIFTGPTSSVYARTAGIYVQPKRWTGPRCFPGP